MMRSSTLSLLVVVACMLGCLHTVTADSQLTDVNNHGTTPSASSSPYRVTALPGWNEPISDEMYTGYLPVQDAFSSQLFYWLSMARNPATISSNTPVVLWLQGGPGCSGGLGWFLENGSEEKKAKGTEEGTKGEQAQ